MGWEVDMIGRSDERELWEVDDVDIDNVPLASLSAWALRKRIRLFARLCQKTHKQNSGDNVSIHMTAFHYVMLLSNINITMTCHLYSLGQECFSSTTEDLAGSRIVLHDQPPSFVVR
jgi:hypothetical protein